MDLSVAFIPGTIYGDWTVVGGDLAVCGGIESAVAVSLFTDRLASADFIDPDPNAIADRRGHWSDTYEGALIGSRLWQLNRAKIGDAGLVLKQARDYCLEALQWLVDDGVAGGVSVQTFWQAPGAMGIIVQVAIPTGQAALEFRFQWAWAGIF